MADDSQMMNDLSSLADAHQEAKPSAGAAPNKFATGPGSGPTRGRRQASTQATIAPPKPRYIPDPPSWMATLVWGLTGLGLLLLALLSLIPQLNGILSKIRFLGWIQNVPAYGTFLAHLFAGFGFLAIAHSRGMTRRTYEIGVMKDRKDAHGWKISLLAVQGFILYSIGVYLLGVDLHTIPFVHWGWPPVESLVSMIAFLLVIIGYAVWFMLAYVSHRFPDNAGRIMAMIAIAIAAMSFILWSAGQELFPSMILGFYALICAIASLLTSSSDDSPRRMKFRYLFLGLTVLLLIPPAIGMLRPGAHTLKLVDLGPAYKSVQGELSSLTYSPDGKTLALAQLNEKRWDLLVFDPAKADHPLSVPAGESKFRPLFVLGGKGLVADFTVQGVRNLYRVDTESGLAQPLTREGVLAEEEGQPWSDVTGKFLYGTRVGEDYEVRTVDPLKGGKPLVLYRDPKPMKSFGWFDAGKKITWVGGDLEHPVVCTMDLATKKITVVGRPEQSNDESNLTPEGQQALSSVEAKLKIQAKPKTREVSRINLVVAAPDNFRLAYTVKTGKTTDIWAVLTDGEMAKDVYSTYGEISDVAWTPDGQQLVFQETTPRWTHFFVNPVRNIRVLDVNVGTSATLIQPQFGHHAPALSPDGVKIAFLGSPGLWYPQPFSGWSTTSGIWVGVLR